MVLQAQSHNGPRISPVRTARLLVDDVLGEIEHVLRDFDVLDFVENTPKRRSGDREFGDAKLICKFGDVPEDLSAL
jgi:hypothetical protein